MTGFRSKPRSVRLASLTISVLLFCVFAEVLSLVVYYYETGHLFYTWRRTYQPIPETQNRQLTPVGLHPYFGPTHTSGRPFEIPENMRRPPKGAAGTGGSAQPQPRETNNLGFVSPHNYPFIKKGDDQFVIGILGGSVALWFCEIGAPRLLDTLKQNGFFKSKDLIPLCLSHEGYKQPQQLLVLSYLLSIGQQFDLVINIDGFNEVALSSINDQKGWDVSMPSFIHLDPLVNLVNESTLTPEKLQSLAAISGYKNTLNNLAGTINRNQLASVNFVLERFYRIASNRYRAELQTFGSLPSVPSQSSLIHVTPKLRERDGTTVFKDIAAGWARASVLMSQLLAASATPYFHVLQPNQYHTRRVFGDAEAAVALSNESPFKDPAEKGYPLLVEESRTLKHALHFFDATRIFDNEPSAVYMDSCCHYTLRGNDILADLIAAQILSSTGPWSPATTHR